MEIDETCLQNKRQSFLVKLNEMDLWIQMSNVTSSQQ